MQSELDLRGVSLEELNALMAEQGIDITDLQLLFPFELGQLQLAIEQLQYSKELNADLSSDTFGM